MGQVEEVDIYVNGDCYKQEKPLVIDFKDAIFAKARVYASLRLGDEYQSDMVIIDAGHSLE